MFNSHRVNEMSRLFWKRNLKSYLSISWMLIIIWTMQCEILLSFAYCLNRQDFLHTTCLWPENLAENSSVLLNLTRRNRKCWQSLIAYKKNNNIISVTNMPFSTMSSSPLSKNVAYLKTVSQVWWLWLTVNYVCPVHPWGLMFYGFLFDPSCRLLLQGLLFNPCCCLFLKQSYHSLLLVYSSLTRCYLGNLFCESWGLEGRYCWAVTGVLIKGELSCGIWEHFCMLLDLFNPRCLKDRWYRTGQSCNINVPHCKTRFQNPLIKCPIKGT